MKKLFGIFMAAVTVIAACVGFVGCKEMSVGKVYTLQIAYDEGFLTREDLEQIAYYNNKHETPEKGLDPKIERAIKKTLAAVTRIGGDPAYRYKASDFIITNYYGEYNGCYAYLSTIKDTALPAVVDQEEVAGIMFYYPYPNHIEIYKANN